MGLFDKKECDICGEKIGLLGNRKLEDGNMCKDCAKLLSPLFSDRRESTVQEIQEQLEYRRQNELAVKAFQPTRSVGKDNEIKVDERNGTFIYCKSDDWRDRNPDVIGLAQVMSCTLDIREDEQEIYREGRDGGRESYNPPRHKTMYEFWMDIQINSPWFDDINYQLSGPFEEIDDRYGHEFRQYEQMGYEICAALGRPMQGGAYSQQGGYAQPQGGYPPQQGGYAQPQGGYPPQQGGYAQPQGGYPPQQGGYAQPQGGYHPQQGGYAQPQGGYPPQQGGYAQPQGGYPPQQGGFQQPQGGYPPQQGGFQQPQQPMQSAQGMPMGGTALSGICSICQATTAPDPSGKCPFCGSDM